ncbi:hypothetical protein AV530_016563 [Patagioenas fasciata monilis]|uniref:Uncharacterized protein n=1 Tax=Patagioenas fasciata monilis TaxID=372326 RepID=A0A1V4J2P2_PATFA|nr:hypothetical protein AV530_016563 [Patagioenas fasciata monilis]
MLEQEKTVRCPFHEEEGVAETMYDELISNPIPHPPVLLEKEKAQHKCPPDFVNANNPKDDYVLSSGVVKLLLN